MADDHSQRPYRSSETIARSGQARSTSSAAGSDPLAELARLIGQTDPFGDLGKEPRRAPATAPAAAPAAIDWSAPPPQSFAPHQPAPPVAPSAYPPQAAPPFNPPQYEPGTYDNAGYDQAYAQPPAGDLYQVEQEVPAYLTQRGAAAGYDQHGYASGHQGHDGHDGYDDAPPRRRLGVLAIAGIFALAVVGTAGAFGYRAVFGGTGTRVPPPVIKADTAPSKIVPENAAKDSTKVITERVNGAGEKIVSREEKPVDIKDKIATPLYPPVTGQGGTALASAGNGIIDTEPRKVHTIVIRPDQPLVADAASMRAAPPPQQGSPVAMPEPQQPRAAAPPLAPARASTAAPPSAPEPPQRAAQAAPRAPAPPPAHSANAPLSLNPDAAPASRAPTRVASSAPTSLAAAPSANPAHAAKGGYAVQVTSQRSEAEAQAAFRSLQGKYAGQLGGKAMFIHKVELGAKGTYYRAMVGPFATQAEASQLCSGLKSAGGSCLVQRN